MTSHEKFEEMVYVYSIGALDGKDLADFENHLNSGCDVCRKLLKDNTEVVSIIPYSIDPESPPTHLERRIMNSVSKSKQTYDIEQHASFWQRISPVWYGLSTAAVTVLLLVSVMFNFQYQRNLEDKNLKIDNLNKTLISKNIDLQSLKSQIKSNQLELVSLKDSYGKYGEVTNYLQDPNVIIINLVSLLPDLKAVGRILWQTENNNVVFVSSNLPVTPPGKIYQLWLIADGSPKSVGIFNVDPDGENIVNLGKLSDVKGIQKFAVTLEPDGGVPLPTGEMYLAGDA